MDGRCASVNTVKVIPYILSFNKTSGNSNSNSDVGVVS